MIDAITVETAHLLGDALPMMHRLRYRVFVERQGYDVPSVRGMEWDEFDTPAAVYLIWRDERGVVGGVARLIPTTFPYMIKALWPDMVAGHDLPSQPDIWELTRLGVDRTLPPATRARVIGELMCACGEFALQNGIKAYLMVTAPQMVKSAIAAAGWPTELLGEPRNLGRFHVVVAKATVTEEGLQAARCFHGIQHPVLRMVAEEMAIAA